MCSAMLINTTLNINTQLQTYVTGNLIHTVKVSYRVMSQTER